MSHRLRTAFMFPGQGSYLPGVLSGLAEEFPAARRALAGIDATCAECGREGPSALLLDPASPSLDDLAASRPADLDLALFAGNMAVFEILSSLGQRPDVMIGHSFGEMSALTAAGALSLADATRLVCTRAELFQQLSPPSGGLVAVAADSRRTAHLVGLLDEPDVVLAVDNGPEQCVVSGTDAGLAQVKRLAETAGIPATRLRAAFPFHNPVLHPVADAVMARVADITLTEPRVPVYSPIAGGYVETVADLRIIAERHLLRPVLFYDGLLRLHRDGVRAFIECGGRDTLSRLVTACLPPGSTVVAPVRTRCQADGLRQSLAGIAAEHSAVAATPAATVSAATPGLAPDAGVKTPGAAVTMVPAPREAEQPAIEPDPSAASGGQTGLPEHEQLVEELRGIYAELLGYPVELLEPGTDLEADLGVDSIKQVEAFVTVRTRYGLGEPPEDLRVTSFTTIADLAGLLRRLAADMPLGVPAEGR